MCQCWFVSCVHLHRVAAALDDNACYCTFLHRLSQRTTRPWLPWPRPSPRMCCLLTWMTMREGTNTNRHELNFCTAALRNNWECVDNGRLLRGLIKSQAGHRVLPSWPLCATVACSGASQACRDNHSVRGAGEAVWRRKRGFALKDMCKICVGANGYVPQSVVLLVVIVTGAISVSCCTFGHGRLCLEINNSPSSS